MPTLQVKRVTQGRYGAQTVAVVGTVEAHSLAPAGSTEMVNGQATVVDDDTAYAAYDVAVQPSDILAVPDGEAIPAGDYQINGRPQRFKNPFTGEERGTVIRLNRVTG